jgi:hypothetical protein
LTGTLSTIGVLAWYRVSNDAAVEKLEANARKRFEPITLAELAAKHPAIPDAENAAVLLMDLWEQDDPEFWKAFRSGVRPLPDRRRDVYDTNLPFLGSYARGVTRLGVLSPEGRAVAEAWVSSNKTHTAAIQDALRKRPKVRFQIQLTDGISALLPHLASMKSEWQKLRIETLLATERGDVAAALGTLQDAGRLANALKDDPFLIDQLVRIGLHSGMITDCERLVSRQTLGIADLMRLTALLESLEMSGALKESLVAERASSLSLYEMPESSLKELSKSSEATNEEPIDPAHAQLGIKLINLTGIVSADRRFMLETMERAIELAEKGTPESLVEFDALFADVEKHGKAFPPKLISSLMLPALRNVARKFTALEARRRAALTAIAVERYRLENQNRLPKGLDELIPRYMEQLPTDPFDGKPLRFRSLEKGFVVYSVGADRADNSGQERPLKGQATEFDETFYIEH